MSEDVKLDRAAVPRLDRVSSWIFINILLFILILVFYCSVEMDYKLSLNLPTISEDNSNIQEPDTGLSAESPSSESSLSSCEDGKLKIAGNVFFNTTVAATSLNSNMFASQNIKLDP